MRRIVRAAMVILALLCLAVQAQGFQLETPFFSEQTVMVLVPHQDDEINLVGGIIEQYTSAGSRVYLVYATNGDYSGLAEVRSQEVLEAAACVGIPAENVIYLGYGNQWQHQGSEKHIYFSADGDRIWTSHFGAQTTYGTSLIQPWRNDTYTRNHFVRDLTELILELMPDVIYCNDYDAHHDHMALDLFFEEVMGNILAGKHGYYPTVYKGFCYGTAWYAEADFVGAQNIRSTIHPVWEHWERLGIGYDWEERVRLPLSAENLSRMLSATNVYQALQCFSSQNGHNFAESVLNGDKVFFKRRTDSLLYDADFHADAEAVLVWNDFKLKDSTDFSALVNTGVHYAAVIDVTLPEPRIMDSVWLYDNPSAEDNILGGYLEFTDGFQVSFGPLELCGTATKISFQPRTVGSFRLHLTHREGAASGLTEIEAYLDAVSEPPQILMVTDENGDFVYDYWMPKEGSMDFTLYTYPSELSWTDVDISMEGSAKWMLAGNRLRIICPPGKQADFTITGAEGVSVSFTVSNPRTWVRTLVLLCQRLDRDAAIAAADRKIAVE